MGTVSAFFAIALLADIYYRVSSPPSTFLQSVCCISRVEPSCDPALGQTVPKTWINHCGGDTHKTLLPQPALEAVTNPLSNLSVAHVFVFVFHKFRGTSSILRGTGPNRVLSEEGRPEFDHPIMYEASKIAR